MSIPFKKYLIRTAVVALISLVALAKVNALSLSDQGSTSDTSLMSWLAKQSTYELGAAQLSAFVNTRSSEDLAKDIDINLMTIASMQDYLKDNQAILVVLDQLSSKAPTYKQNANFVLIKARLLLADRQFDAARTLLRERWDERALANVCAPDEDQVGWGYDQQESLLCAPRVRSWLREGKLAAIDWPSIAIPTIYDARAQCAFSIPEKANAIETALDRGRMAPSEHAKLSVHKAWSAFLAGCETLQFNTAELLSAAYGENVLRDEYQSALASVSIERPSSLLLFGDSLPLPPRECDFDRAPDCSKTKPLTKLSAQRIAQRLSKLNRNFSAEIGQCVEVPETERQRRKDLEKTLAQAIKKIMAESPAQSTSQRLAALDKLLDTSLSGLEYEMHELLSEPLMKLVESDALGAIAVQKKLISVLGMKASDSHWIHLAKLQLVARLPNDAANSFKQALAMKFDDEAAAALALLEAVQTGARPDFFSMPDRPWTYQPEGLEFEPSTQNIVYLGTLPTSALKEYQVRQYWQQVLAGAWMLANGLGDEELSEMPKVELVGKWRGESFVVGTLELPWPDNFSIENAPAQAISEPQRAKLFNALGVVVN